MTLGLAPSPVKDFSPEDQDAKSAEVHSQESCDEIQNVSLSEALSNPRRMTPCPSRVNVPTT